MDPIRPRGIPEDPLPPETDPCGSLEPPRRVPPGAIGTLEFPFQRDPETGPILSRRRLTTLARAARAVLAVLASITVLIMIIYDVRFIPAAVVPGIVALLCAHAAAAAEGLERTIYRRWRWMRIRYQHRRRVVARSRLRDAA